LCIATCQFTTKHRWFVFKHALRIDVDIGSRYRTKIPKGPLIILWQKWALLEFFIGRIIYKGVEINIISASATQTVIALVVPCGIVKIPLLIAD
jgi:hypothetical protein